ncbi:MAG: PQQ-binding-like beta-propeller repeat protein [Candidatus Hydrogenedentes bacterium]|nr:PQQ-binding-like beta-propeller repeat protein [Candidatus Hydrogenedentota bacterium]
MRVAWVGLLWLIAPCAFGLDLLWKCPTESAARSLPTVADLQGDGSKRIVLTTRFDGAVKIIGPDGALLNSFVRENWMEGCVATAAPASQKRPLFAYQDSTGALYLSDLQSGLNLRADLEGEPRIGTSPCFADLRRNGEQGVVVGRRNGIVTAFDLGLNPLWQYQTGSHIDSSPAVAPVYAEEAVVYVVSSDGVLHAVGGRGWPLWRFRMDYPSPAFPSLSDPLVAFLGQHRASVLISDREGWLYAIDALDGSEQWRAHAGGAALGTPALAEVTPGEGRAVVAVSEQGDIAILDGSGQIARRAALPKGSYVPRPLVADVDGDGAPEILVAAQDWSFLVTTLDGVVKERVEMQGCAREGLTLANVRPGETLELLAATDCGQTYCYATRAKTGWTHPRSNAAFDGAVEPIVPARDFPSEAPTRKTASTRMVSVTDYAPNMPFGFAIVDIGRQPRVAAARAVVRVDGAIAGSTSQDLTSTRVGVPFIHRDQGVLTLDLGLYDRKGKRLLSASALPIRSPNSKPIDLTSPENFFAALSERGASYALPDVWRLPAIQGRDSWHVARFMPDLWKTFGLAGEPFISEAIPRIAASASAPFGPRHPAWDTIARDTKPFFVMNDYFRPEAPYTAGDVDAIVSMPGDRFLGFPVHEWAYAAWKSRLENAASAPESRADATSLLKSYYDEVQDLSHGRIYAGEGYCLFHHQAYEWGAPMCYAEIGENIPCASLQFAFLRGAAREYGGRPWGAYLSNWFRGAVTDTRLFADGRPVHWAPPDMATGPNCGHSPNLEYRLEMAAHLAGASFVHHESDAHNGSIFVQETARGRFSPSPFGSAMKEWYTYSRTFPQRGVPFTPIAFMLDFDHGWRPREDIYGIWPRTRADQSLEMVFAQVFPWGGRLDFERGYLANGPYGDIFDVITNHAQGDALNHYGVVWPLGAMTLSRPQRDSLIDYVKQGGVLVMDGALAQQLPGSFLGLGMDSSLGFATEIQTALGAAPPLSAPFRFRRLTPSRRTEILAWTETGAPILAWRRVGNGVLIVSGTEHWLDERERLVPLADVLLRALSDAFLPVSLTGDVEMMINRTPDAWIIGLINNNGVTKTPTRPMNINMAGARDCLLKFKDKVLLSFAPRRGEMTWNRQAGALNAHLAPGDVAVVEVKISNKE